MKRSGKGDWRSGDGPAGRDAGVPVAAREEREGCSLAAGGRHGLPLETQTLPNPKCDPSFPPRPPLLL
jgi:hypothetical protein